MDEMKPKKPVPDDAFYYQEVRMIDMSLGFARISFCPSARGGGRGMPEEVRWLPSMQSLVNNDDTEDAMVELSNLRRGCRTDRCKLEK